MKRYRSRFRQLMSAHPISGAGSSLLAALYGELPRLLPTPTSRDATSGPGRAATAQGSPNLRTVLLPTPTASSYGSNRGGAAGRDGAERPSLPTMAKSGLLPTPVVSTGSYNRGGQNPEGPIRPTLRGLPRALGQRTRCLNPAFVEWMMGFPPGWLDLEEPSD
jgi:hypothetical protein